MTITSTSIRTVEVDSEPTAKARWRPAITLILAAVIATVLFVFFGRGGEIAFSIAGSTNEGTPPLTFAFPARGVGIVVTVSLALSALLSVALTRLDRATPLWLNVCAGVLTAIGFVSWAAAGNSLSLVGLLGGALALSVPLIFGALGGVVSERVGVVNIAIEGQLLAGAFVSAVAGSITGSLIAGLVAAMVAGMAVSLLLALFALRYLVDQVIVGVVINVLVLGLTSFFYSTVLVPNASEFNSPPQFEVISIPLLSAIPLIGPVFFKQTIIVYVAYLAVGVVAYALFRTKWGLRVRAVGEHPLAAETVGVRVVKTRLYNLLLAGAIAGVGGAFFTLGSVGAFSKGMTSGAGFIALAAVIFGGWHPLKATAAALLFGFAMNLQFVLGQLKEPSPVPTDFLLMLPYFVTIVAVAGLVGKSRPPAASGKPYSSR